MQLSASHQADVACFYAQDSYHWGDGNQSALESTTMVKTHYWIDSNCRLKAETCHFILRHISWKSSCFSMVLTLFNTLPIILLLGSMRKHPILFSHSFRSAAHFCTTFRRFALTDINSASKPLICSNVFQRSSSAEVVSAIVFGPFLILDIVSCIVLMDDKANTITATTLAAPLTPSIYRHCSLRWGPKTSKTMKSERRRAHRASVLHRKVGVWGSATIAKQGWRNAQANTDPMHMQI